MQVTGETGATSITRPRRHRLLRAAVTVGLFVACVQCLTFTRIQRTVTIDVNVPPDTSDVYLACNVPEYGPWDPKRLPMRDTGAHRTLSLRVTDGSELEYKYTAGSLDVVATERSGELMMARRITVDDDMQLSDDVGGFVNRIDFCIGHPQGSGVIGRLEYVRDVRSKFLKLTRNVEVWLPPEYDKHPEQRYAVIYMHDGQSLFDSRLTDPGIDWGVDEAIVRNVRAGKMPPVIVVGAWSTDERWSEYSPWHEGPRYGRFLIEELMPVVNQRYRTLTGPENTTLMGSSMGALISFWMVWKHPDVFGAAGCLSTHFTWGGTRWWYPGQTFLIEKELTPQATFPKDVRLYFDYGTHDADKSYEPPTKKVAAFLASRGLVEGKKFVVKKFPGARHSEAAWRARLDEPLQFLFAPQARATSQLTPATAP